MRHIRLAIVVQVGRAVPGLGQLPRGTLEAPLRDLATTLDFGQPVASMQVCSLQTACVLSASLASECPQATESAEVWAGMPAYRANGLQVLTMSDS